MNVGKPQLLRVSARLQKRQRQLQLHKTLLLQVPLLKMEPIQVPRVHLLEENHRTPQCRRYLSSQVHRLL